MVTKSLSHVLDIKLIIVFIEGNQSFTGGLVHLSDHGLLQSLVGFLVQISQIKLVNVKGKGTILVIVCVIEEAFDNLGTVLWIHSD